MFPDMPLKRFKQMQWIWRRSGNEFKRMQVRFYENPYHVIYNNHWKVWVYTRHHSTREIVLHPFWEHELFSDEEMIQVLQNSYSKFSKSGTMRFLLVDMDRKPIKIPEIPNEVVIRDNQE